MSVIYVDNSGNTPGAHATITAGINAAVAAGAAVGVNQKTVRIYGGGYVENFNVPAGVTLIGDDMHATYITTTLPVVMVSGSGMINLYIYNPAPDVSGNPVGINCQMTGADPIVLTRVKLYVNRDWVNHTVGITHQGTGAGIVMMHQCYIYVRNPYTAAHSGTARAVIYRALAGTQNTYVEAIGCHFKTSTAGTARPILVWNQGTGAYVGMDASTSHWGAIFAAAPELILNENATYRGGMLDVSITTSDVASRIDFTNPHAGAAQALYSQVFNNLDVVGRFTQRYQGQDFPLVPVIRSASAPTVADVAPENTLWVVAP